MFNKDMVRVSESSEEEKTNEKKLQLKRRRRGHILQSKGQTRIIIKAKEASHGVEFA